MTNRLRNVRGQANAWLLRAWTMSVRTARLMIGIADYDRYVAHVRQQHPDRTVMSYVEFFNERQAARYRGGGGRCC